MKLIYGIIIYHQQSDDQLIVNEPYLMSRPVSNLNFKMNNFHPDKLPDIMRAFHFHQLSE